MINFYIDGKEVNRNEFEKYWGHDDIGWKVDTMILNNIKEYEKKSPYNRMCKIIIN